MNGMETNNGIIIDGVLYESSVPYTGNVVIF